MSRFRRPGKNLFKALWPLALLLVLGFCGAVGWLVYEVVRPPRSPYLITPQTFTAYSLRALKISDERWPNRDGTEARGWLLRGAEGAPAVIMLHSYGADRSWLLNLGVKLNETTNYTVLWPDLRGHGQEPLISATTLGAREADDVLAAVDYLRSLKTPQQKPLTGGRIGFFGVELGGYAALLAASRQSETERAPALALDSVPTDADMLLHAALQRSAGVDNGLLQWLARAGTRLYFLGSYQNVSACEAAPRLSGVRVLLLTGRDANQLRDSTTELAKCLPAPALVELYSDLQFSGVSLASATAEQGEAYDRRVIDFFDRALQAP